MMKKKDFILFPILFFVGLNLCVLSIFRLGLALWQEERVSAVRGWLSLFLQGVRIDIVALCWLFGLAALLQVLLFSTGLIGRIWQKILVLWLTLGSVFIFFMELATPAFIETYDLRPNLLFVEYLIYPQEVFTMLVNGHLWAVLLCIIVGSISLFCYWKLAIWSLKNVSTSSWKIRPILALLVITISVMGARSTLAHRGINPAMVAFSSDPLVNSLVLNSGYSVIYAIQQLKNEEQSSEQYGYLEPDELIDIIKQQSERSNSDYIDPHLPTLSYNQATYQGKAKNIVIILQESLGSQFIDSLGGKPLSPEFDKLAQQGWLFENLYATGTRSVRGIEAVIAGFTPTPARSTVKLAKSQQGFFTIAQLLKQQGYHTSFIYGGEKHFDNMASYFYGNGFSQIIDEKDYNSPTFKGTWGVSDEDLFDKANEVLTQLAQRQQPFFSLIFTSSNHDPFEFPANKIALYEQPKQTRNNAAKYADYALGHFFRLAKQSNYWKDTIFLVIADHDSRVAGDMLVPIQHFHIPGLILGEGIAPYRDQRLVSQIDMPTTLLSLAGISGEYPMIGADLTRPFNPNRALMQYDQTQAMMKGNEVVILKPDSLPKGYYYDKHQYQLIEQEVSEQLKKEALAYALLGSYLYKQQLYKLPLK